MIFLAPDLILLLVSLETFHDMSKSETSSSSITNIIGMKSKIDEIQPDSFPIE